MYSDDDVAADRFDNIALCQVHTVGSCLGEANHGKLPDDVLSSVIREKAFTAMELTLMLKIAGFSVEHIWGVEPQATGGPPSHSHGRDGADGRRQA